MAFSISLPNHIGQFSLLTSVAIDVMIPDVSNSSIEILSIPEKGSFGSFIFEISGPMVVMDASRTLQEP